MRSEVAGVRVVNPANGEEICVYRGYSDEAIDAAIERAEDAIPRRPRVRAQKPTGATTQRPRRRPSET